MKKNKILTWEVNVQTLDRLFEIRAHYPILYDYDIHQHATDIKQAYYHPAESFVIHGNCFCLYNMYKHVQCTYMLEGTSKNRCISNNIIHIYIITIHVYIYTYTYISTIYELIHHKHNTYNT